MSTFSWRYQVELAGIGQWREVSGGGLWVPIMRVIVVQTFSVFLMLVLRFLTLSLYLNLFTWNTSRPLLRGLWSWYPILGP